MAVVDSRNIIVGHIPHCIAPTVSNFLKRTVNKGSVQVTGDRVNRGTGYSFKYHTFIACMVTFQK